MPQHEESPYYDLGSYHRPIRTQNELAQVWFDRGLIWSYAFNHEESATCFEKAVECDNDCVMAYWGLAFSLGPNYNKPWEGFDEGELERNLSRANHATQNAEIKARRDDATSVERLLVHALQARYPSGRAAEDCSMWNADYARRMEDVYQKCPNDLDVAALYADSLMNLTPWALWDLHTGKPARESRTLEVKAVLDRALAQPGGREHPGILHLYVHLMEMSSTPELALNAADGLRGLVPDAGHLNHMPTHLDILCGDYRRAIASNTEAIRGDEKFLARAGALNFYSLYRCHDYHFCIYAAMFAGQYQIAINTAHRLESTLPDELLRIQSPPMADWLEGFLSVKIHVLVRFGRWSDVLALEVPSDQDLYCVTTAMTYYAKGVAHAALGQVSEAESTRSQFRQAWDKVAASRTLFNNTCTEILAVASSMLDGELEYRRCNYDSAFQHLRRSIELSDSLPYDEPWGWMQPPRHAYGALLLEQGAVEEAAAVYSADLGLDDTLPRALQHPNNVWALQGYVECLKVQKRDAEARILQRQLTLALATADIPINTSCFCRTMDSNSVSLP